ncbi:MAG: polysulfide reductase NrfD [Acidobacteria bacterium]|nr:polysulfide reductase NrfD [Acidobacteriota bacterium]
MSNATTVLGPDEILLDPITRTGKGFYWLVAVLALIGFGGLGAWVYQLMFGLGVTGLNRPVYWGVYITNFVFFIGISHAGTLISAILRLCHAEWRRPITRAAEVITVMVLFFGAGSVILDLGRPDRALNVIFHGQVRSPLIWDVLSISTYLTGSIIYLYLPLIPDIALLRDRMPHRRIYRLLAVGWQGTPKQHRVLEKAIAIMAVIIVPIAVSVHTVVSWVFAMTVQPMWHSTIFGPYFVVGAIFSGIAALIVAMALIRHFYHLEDYLKPVSFNNLGLLLLVMSLLWLYFTFAEYLTTYYGAEPFHMTVFSSKVTGRFAIPFWSMFVLCFVIPAAILGNKKTRTVKGCVIASIAVIIGMWLERYIIVVPTLSRPRLAVEVVPYAPTWVEMAMTASFFSLFILLYLLFTKFFPIISVWEIKEGREKSVSDVVERVQGYLPGDSSNRKIETLKSQLGHS